MPALVCRCKYTHGLPPTALQTGMLQTNDTRQRAMELIRLYSIYLADGQHVYLQGKEDKFVIGLRYEYEYDELTWQDWMKLRYKITPNPNLNDLDDTRRRETLKHLLPSGSPDVLPDEWPWDYEIRTDLSEIRTKMHNRFSDSEQRLDSYGPTAKINQSNLYSRLSKVG